MKNKTKIILIILAVLVVGFLWPKGKPGHSSSGRTVKECKPAIGNIQKYITATAAVQPMNRLEMKPPIGGRVDEINVEEGQKVKVGDILALMSSTDRAALLDAARLEGEKAVAYWKEVYRPTPLIAPIDGEVIVRTIQPGQTVTTADAVLVLSDRLIVEAQIDETDIGRVREGMPSVITLDAYPDVVVNAKVGHIYHESKIINNVTIYQADILPDTVPDVFRSGMSANVRILEASRENVLLVPVEMVKHDKEGSYVWVKKKKQKKPVRQKVEVGVSDDANVEILSGVDANDTLTIEIKKYSPAQAKSGGANPFMPAPPGSSQRKTN